MPHFLLPALLLSAVPQSGTPVARLIGLEGAVQELPLSALDLADPRTKQAWRVRFPASAIVEVPADSARVRLWSGELLHGEWRGGKEESFVFSTTSGVPLVLGIEELDALEYPARVPAGWGKPIEPAAEGDRLYRRSREALDLLGGGTQAFQSAGIAFDINGIGVKEIPIGEVAALFIDREARELYEPKAGAGTPVELDLTDGGRLQGSLVRLSLAGCELVRAGGERLEIPLQAIAQLSVRDGRLSWLSALPVSEAPACSPFGDDLGLQWPSRMDRSVSGGRLRVRSEVSARGIGMHAPNRIAWQLDGSEQRLTGAVGIDDSTRELAARGSVIFRVLCDGKEVWSSGIVRGGEAARALPAIELRGVRRLELAADDAGDGFAGDRANWLELALSR